MWKDVIGFDENLSFKNSFDLYKTVSMLKHVLIVLLMVISYKIWPSEVLLFANKKRELPTPIVRQVPDDFWVENGNQSLN